ncbi:glycoside hydrolase family 19 protein [Rhizobium laguerreae]|uniref:glycoside hydrolase family 19 protein n=1 Tax=Rhizobium laguerreae TaxID=1076926 RepID=UPI001C91926C|nr:glycoside hydrolase family 19 protein [Rhizobium laguerreae]MBY3257052.1 glycoside hydrolase family 19 protein [Rhizobium laguerreae]MBY3282413.1 glycoside hydrolase family 19 protein [Rhizobium laguerreae]MBY3291940.1 glycoside hydrolase family 19 protein [Rhizobium laguerreae]
MSSITAQQIRAAAKGPVNEGNLKSVLIALDRYGDDFGMNRRHRLVQFLAQLMHESGDFRYDREIWGPTPAQKRYDTRVDLGNTPAVDGDGKKNAGRGPIQLTGAANIKEFYDWCDDRGLNPPNFVANPDLINTDPWEGLSALFYWDTRNLNRLADQGDIETITKKTNGGMNGFADRVEHLVRLSLVVLGYAPHALKQFQAANGLNVDDDPGPKTRAALHKALLAADGVSMAAAGIMAAPVVEEKAVVPHAVEGEVKRKFSLLGWAGSAFGGGGGLGLAALTGFDWRALVVIIVTVLAVAIGGLVLRHYIIAAIKDIRAAVES